MVSRRKIVPFIVAFGAENYFLDEEVAKARAWKGRTVRRLDGRVCKAADVVHACEALSLDGDDRVVILDNAQGVRSDKVLCRYIEDRDVKDDSIVLVAICRSDKLPEVWAAAAKKGILNEYRKLKTYETNNEVIHWLQAEAKHRGLVLGDGVAEMLFKWIGADLYKLDNELRKFLVLVGSGGRVEQEHVRQVTTPMFPVEPAQVADAMFRKDVKGALNAVALLYKTMGDDALLPILAGMLRQAEKLTLARYLLDAGNSDDDVAALLGYNPWWCRTFFLPTVRKHDLSSLIRAMGRLSRLDADVKGPSQCKRTLLELAVIAIAH